MYCDYIQPLMSSLLSSFPYEPFIFSTSPSGYTIEEIDTSSSHGKH